MLKKVFAASLGLAMLAIGIFGCSPAGPKEFSADSVSKYQGKRMESKMYFGKGKWRFESSAFGQKNITIVRKDNNTVWVVMPQQKMYMEQKLDPKQLVSLSGSVPGEIKREKLGSENINGVSCDKYKITYRPQEKAPEASLYQWLSKDQLPMKSEALDGSWTTELKNVKLGQQPDSLFELPAGYKLFKLPKMRLQ